MSDSKPDLQPDRETLEHLLGVVVENREKRCQELRDKANQQAADIVSQAYRKVRGRLHRHVNELREKYRLRVASATARNQTLLRQQHHKEERALLDVAWPMLHTALLAMWESPESRYRWIEAAVGSAESRLRHTGWRIEHPRNFSEDDGRRVQQMLAPGRQPELKACDDIEAGVRIVLDGTVVDATLVGLLKRKSAIEAIMIARINREAMGHD